MRKTLLSLLALVLLASGCSAFGAAPAATVGGTEITTDSIEAEVEAILGNEPYRERLEAQSPIEGTAKGTFDAAFVAQVLTLRIYYQAIEDRLEDQGVEVEREMVDEAELDLREQFETSFGVDTWEAFPAAYREQLMRQSALFTAVQQHVTEEVGGDPEAFFEENEDLFAEICVSHVLVGVQGGRTPEEAEARAEELREQIEAGELDFEAAAREQSDDTVAAQDGGELGCGTRQSFPFDPTFEAAAFDLEVDELSEPVVTQFGAHLILVTERTTPDYEDVEQDVPAVMQEQLGTGVDQYLVDALCEVEVDVNARYGTWNDDACHQVGGGLPAVEPPEGPIREAEPGIEFDL